MRGLRADTVCGVEADYHDPNHPNLGWCRVTGGILLRGIWNRVGALGLEGWVFGLTGLASIVFSVASFLGYVPLSIEQTLQIVVGAVGALMLAVVTQSSKRSAEIQDIRNALGVADIQRLDTGLELPEHLVLSSKKAKSFVTETFMNWEKPRINTITYLLGEDGNNYNRVILERVTKNEISYRQVQVVYHKQGLEELIHRLLLHEGYGYYIRHYDEQSSAIPMLHVTSFDDEVFYLGVGYPKGQPAKNEVIRLRETNTQEILKQYWNILWESASTLNEGGWIEWDKLRRIGERVGVKDKDFDEMVSRVELDVRRFRRPKKRVVTAQLPTTRG